MTKDTYIINYRIVYPAGGQEDIRIKALSLEDAKSKINIAKEKGYKNIGLTHKVIEETIIKNETPKILTNFFDFILKSILVFMLFSFALGLCNIIFLTAKSGEGRTFAIVFSVLMSLIFIIYEFALVFNALKNNKAEFINTKIFSEKKFTSEELLDL